MSITKALVQFDSEFDYLELRLNTIPDKPVVVNLLKDGICTVIYQPLNDHFKWSYPNAVIKKGFTVIMEKK